jgi:hypothetical protein
MPTTPASGVNKSVRYKKQTAHDTLPGTSGGQVMRRVSATGKLTKQIYESDEITTDAQDTDVRHGVRSSSFSIRGRLSPGTYADFIASIVAKAWAATTAITGLSITVAASGSNYTVTRAAGSWITDGIKVCDVVRLTAGVFNAANLNNNLVVLSLTATALTVTTLNKSSLVAEGPIASATLSVPGKKTYVPATGHTDEEFFFEEWFPDISRSRRYQDQKFQSMSLEMPPTGLVGINFETVGGERTLASSAYLTSPTAAGTSGLTAAVNGLAIAQGATVALITGFSAQVTRGQQSDPVIGTDVMPEYAEGRIRSTGNVTLKYVDDTWTGYFDGETEVALMIIVASSKAANADFVAIAWPRCKALGDDIDDGEKQILQTVGFRALRNINSATNNMENTTVVIQDSQAP